MSSVNRVNRKASDGDIVRLNACGFSLKTIGQILGLHPTTVTIRLQSLKVPPADTRRSFMEGVFSGLTTPQQEWLSDQLNAGMSVKDYITQLVRKEHEHRTQPIANAQTAGHQPDGRHDSLVQGGEAESDAD